MKEHRKTVFVAEDGKEFFDAAECHLYERRQALKKIIDEHTVYQTEISDRTGLINAILYWADEERNL